MEKRREKNDGKELFKNSRIYKEICRQIEMNSTPLEHPKPHAVCVPWPAQGHIHATLKLAKLLHSKGFHITFVHTEFNYNRILTNGGTSALRSLDDFRFETIPDGLPPSDPTASQDIDALCSAIREKFADPFRSLLKRLNGPTSGVPPVTCVVSDNFTSFTLNVTEQFGIPDVFFCSMSAAAYLGFIKYKELVDDGIMPPNGDVDTSDGYLDTPIDWKPRTKNIIRLRDLLSFPNGTDPNGVKFNFLKDESQEAHRASAVIINTFDELEGEVLHAMSSFLPPVYTVGPLTMLCREILDSSVKAVGSNSLWKEDSDCLEWLDGRASGSVMYLNFGSVAVMTKEQLVEFAWGLSNSGHDFLWVIRPDVVAGDLAILPKEFLDETNARGLLMSWCPQEEVLMHPSIGGFLTHCGWNSMMESISSGVPMLCWPYFADQPTNCWYACNEWGIGVKIENDVKREKVEVMVRELMGAEKGQEMRRKALEWKEFALEATKQGGKSSMNLDRVIKEVLLGKK